MGVVVQKESRDPRPKNCHTQMITRLECVHQVGGTLGVGVHVRAGAQVFVGALTM